VDWTFGDLPERLTITDGPASDLWLRGLSLPKETSMFDCSRAESARAASRAECGACSSWRAKDLAWLEKDLRALSRLEALYAR